MSRFLGRERLFPFSNSFHRNIDHRSLLNHFASLLRFAFESKSSKILARTNRHSNPSPCILREMQVSNNTRWFCNEIAVSNFWSSSLHPASKPCSSTWNWGRNRTGSFPRQVMACPFRQNRFFKSRAQKSNFASYSSSALRRADTATMTLSRPRNSYSPSGNFNLDFGKLRNKARQTTFRRRPFSSHSKRETSSSATGPPKKGDKGERFLLHDKVQSSRFRLEL